MASEQADEKQDPEFSKLVALEQAAEDARVAATAGTYSPEAWAPWLEAATAFQAAVTAYAAAGEGRSRYEVEMRAKKAVRHVEAA